MKRYAIFAGEAGEPAGGWLDYRCSVSSLGEAWRLLLIMRGRYRPHVVDLEVGEIVAEPAEIVARMKRLDDRRHREARRKRRASQSPELNKWEDHMARMSGELARTYQ